MERQTWRRIYLAATGLKLTGLLIYGAFHSMSGSGSVPDTLPPAPTIEIGPKSVNSMFDQLEIGIPMIGPNGQSMLVRDPVTGVIQLIPVTITPTEAWPLHNHETVPHEGR